MEKQKISAAREDGTYITLVGGNNARRIGGNSYVIEARNEGKTSRVMVDLGAVNELLAQGIYTVLITVFTYLMHKYFSFAK